jgi:hypothetical protein
MKRIKVITVLMMAALLCFSAVSYANEVSFYDSGNDWIVRVFTVENVGAEPTYTVYMMILDREGELVPVADIFKNGDPVTENPFVVCDCAIKPDISAAYIAGSAGTDAFIFDTHPGETGDYVQLHNNITLSRNTPVLPQNISVSGSGLFGNVNVGSTSTNFFTVSNTGEANLQLGTIAVTGTGFTRNGGTCSASGQIIAKGASCTIGVQFAPTAATTYSGNLAIPSNDPDTPTANVTLSGSGVQQTGTADLVVSRITHASSISSGATLTIDVYVKNQGTGSAGSFVVKGMKTSSEQMYLWNVPSLAPGQELTQRFSYVVTCPTHSTYYPTHTADANQQVTESNETNNTFTSYIRCSR